ncbi:MAG: ATP-binding protein [Chloroflexota bacterium]|nr:ATP-binding protein [Chloroflexota bacterium]
MRRSDDLVEAASPIAHASSTLRAHLSALKAFSQALTRPLDREELFRAAQRETARALDAPTFLLGLYDEGSQTVEVVCQVERGVELAGGTFPVGSGLTSQVIGSRQSRLIRRWSHNGPPVQLQYASSTPGLPESAVTAPLLFGDQVLGVISAFSYQPDAFDEDDLTVLEVIANQLTNAIANLRNSDSLDTQLQRRVSESEAILANMSDALLVVDNAGRLVRLNLAARKLLCVDATSIVLGQPLDREQWGQWPLGGREVAETLAPMIDVLQRGKVPPTIEIELHGTGRRVLSFSGAPLSDSYGALTGCLLVVRDITGQHEVQRLKDEMLLIASHDLKTPVTVIKGQAQVLRRGIHRGLATLESVDAGLATIVGQVDRLTSLLDLLLDLSQIEAGRLDIKPAPMDLRQLVSTLIMSTQATTDRHRLQLRAPKQLVGKWDERRLQQVVGNLLTNAVKYSPDGGQIDVTIRRGKRWVTVRLRDYGVGLLPEEVEHVFERFYRAKGIRQLEGTGLGLYICEGIVAAHGGRIWVESAGPGQGSEFCFTLPVVDLQQQTLA